MPSVSKIGNFNNKLFFVKVYFIPWNILSVISIWKVNEKVIKLTISMHDFLIVQMCEASNNL